MKPSFVSGAALFADWDHGGIQQHGGFQVRLFSTATTLDPDGLKTLLQSQYIDRFATTHSTNNQNFSGIRDPLIDRSFDVAGGTFNRQTRYRHYAAIQQEMNRRAYWVPLYSRPNVSTSDGRVRHFTPNPIFEGGPFWNMYQWKLK